MTPLGEAFAGMRTALESAGIRFAVGGSWASTAFGEPRFTNDVDILADFTGGGSLSEFLRGSPSRASLQCGNSTTPTRNSHRIQHNGSASCYGSSKAP